MISPMASGQMAWDGSPAAQLQLFFQQTVTGTYNVPALCARCSREQNK